MYKEAKMFGKTVLTGEAYRQALLCINNMDNFVHGKHEFVENIFDSLTFFANAIKEILPSQNSDLIVESLAGQFDIDSVVSFSDAWDYWDDMYGILFEGKEPRTPLDQMLFSGKHVSSHRYFNGIESLANSRADTIAKMLLQLLPPDPERKMLDLGAGPGIYSNVFASCGLVNQSLCVDLPYVRKIYEQKVIQRVSWESANLLEYRPDSKDKYGFVYLANILHHHKKENIARIFNNISSTIDDNGYLVIQDYILWPIPTLSPIYAAILGVHFALTTEGSRCYTNAEITSMVFENIEGMKFYASINVGTADLMVFMKDGRL